MKQFRQFEPVQLTIIAFHAFFEGSGYFCLSLIHMGAIIEKYVPPGRESRLKSAAFYSKDNRLVSCIGLCSV